MSDDGEFCYLSPGYLIWLENLAGIERSYPMLMWSKYLPADPNPFPEFSLLPRNWFVNLKSWL